MKKRLFILIIGLLLMPFTALAADTITLTQTDFTEAKSNPGVDTAKGINYYEDEIAGGAYIPYYRLPRNANVILDGEINLNDGEGIIYLRDNNVTLNSNVALNGSFSTESMTTNTISGSGTVSGGFSQYSGNATINGSITFNGAIVIFNANSMIVNGGTFNKGVEGKGGSDITINDGLFKSADDMDAVYSYDHSSFTINGGIFIGDLCGFDSSDGQSTINGGTFTGGAYGAFFGNNNSKVSGGTFKTTSESTYYTEYGSIGIPNTMTFGELLADGFQYSTTNLDYIISNELQGYLILKATEITVSKIPTDEPAETTTETNTETTDKKEETNNPKTGDLIYIYVMLLVASLGGLLLLRKRLN